MAKYLFLLCALLLSCSHAGKIDSVKLDSSSETKKNRELMIGRWYGEQPTQNGEVRKWLMERRRDGSFTVKFQSFQPGGGKVLEQVEAGIWGVAGDMYFSATREMLNGTSFRAIDTTDPTFYDGYAILELTPQLLRYKSLDSPNEFMVKRVSDQFQLE